MEHGSLKLLGHVFITREGILSENTAKTQGSSVKERRERERFLQVCFAQLELAIPESRSLHTVSKDALHIPALIQYCWESRRVMRDLCDEGVQKWDLYTRNIDVIFK